jgi:four helix bundle protein
LRRASLSILLNIAEGTSRTKKDFSRFINMARGSVFECAAILQVSLDQDYLEKERYFELKEKLVEISKMLSGLKSSLK